MPYDDTLAARNPARPPPEPPRPPNPQCGGLAFLVGGHLSVSASGRGGRLVRVEPEQTDDLAREPGAEPFVMRGRPMDGWLRVSPASLADDAALRRWVQRGLAYARSLPPKD